MEPTDASNTNQKVEKSVKDGLPNANETLERSGTPNAKQEDGKTGLPEFLTNNLKVEKQGRNVAYLQNNLHPQMNQMMPPLPLPPHYFNQTQRFPPHNLPPAYQQMQQSQPYFSNQMGMQPVSVNIQTTYVPRNFPIYPGVYPYQQNLQQAATIKNISQPQPLQYKDVRQPPLPEPVHVLYRNELTESVLDKDNTKKVLASFAKLLEQVLQLPAISKMQDLPTSQQTYLEYESTKEILVNFAQILKKVKEEPQLNKAADKLTSQKPQQNNAGIEKELPSMQLTSQKLQQDNEATGESTPKEVEGTKEVLESFAKLLAEENYDEVKSKEVLVSFAELLQKMLKEEQEETPRQQENASKCSDLIMETSLPINIVAAPPQELQENELASKKRAAVLVIKPKMKASSLNKAAEELTSQKPQNNAELRVTQLSHFERKVYHPDFLLALKNSPKSKEKPANILNDIFVDQNQEKKKIIKKVSKSKVEDSPLKNSPKSKEQPDNILKDIFGDPNQEKKKGIKKVSKSKVEDSPRDNWPAYYHQQANNSCKCRDFLLALKNLSKGDVKPENDSQRNHNQHEIKMYSPDEILMMFKNHPESKDKPI